MRLKSIRNFIVKNKNSILVIAVILVLLSLWFGSSIVESLRLLQLKQDLSSQIIERQEVSKQLDEDIAQIGSQSYIERIARKYLELYYPNEEIVIPVENKIQAETSNENTVTDTVTDNVEVIPEEYIEEDTEIDSYDYDSYDYYDESDDVGEELYYENE